MKKIIFLIMFILLININFAQPQITFMTYNIGEWANDGRTGTNITNYNLTERMQRIANQIMANNVDIVGLQEVKYQSTINKLKQILDNSNYPMYLIYSGENINDHIGKAILSKYKLTDYKLYNDPSTGYNNIGNIQSAKIIIDSKPIRLFNVHLHTNFDGSTTNDELINLIRSISFNEKLFIFGDFNQKKQLINNLLYIEPLLANIFEYANDSCDAEIENLSCLSTIDLTIRTDILENSGIDHILVEKTLVGFQKHHFQLILK